MKYYSILDRPETWEPTAVGSPIVPIYERVEDENGLWHLEKTGEHDIQKEINSARPPAMADILKHALRGDMSMMTNQDGIYASGDEVTDLGEAFLLGQRAIEAAETYRIALEKEMNTNADEPVGE